MRSERGSGSVIGIGLVALLCAALLVVAQVTSHLVAVRLALQAADGAALGAADQLALGNGCSQGREVADRVARANGARLVGFECPGREVTVTVHTASLGWRPAIRRSRAVVDPCVRCG